MRDCTEVYRVVSKLLCSQHKDIQCAAAECIALMSRYVTNHVVTKVRH